MYWKDLMADSSNTNMTINITTVHFLRKYIFVNVKLIRDNFFCGS
jgi:hypothetical protein